MKSRIGIITGLLSGAVLMLATAPAMARADVSVSIGVPGFWQPAQVYEQPQSYYREQQYRQDRHHPRWDRDHRQRHDRDHDGIPNRFDRDRDGDGVPNRYDRRPNNPYRY